jgi:hypothetical protein
MPTKVAEIFAEIKFDMGKAMSDLGSFEQRTSRTSSLIVEKLNAIRRASEFSMKLKGLEGVEQVQGVLDRINGQIGTLKSQMSSLTSEKAGILGAAGFDPRTIERFSGRSGAPTMMGQQISGAGDIAAIDKRRNEIIAQTTELLQFRQVAEAKLNLAIADGEMAENRRVSAASKLHQVRQQEIASVERRNAVTAFATDLTERFTTAEERQAIFLQRLDATYKAGAISAELFAKAQAFGSNLANFQGAAAGFGRLQFAIQQASFGLQDFLVVLGPMGLGGALRASVNNFAQVAAIINPVHGAFIGLGLTIGSVLLPHLLGLSDQFGKTKNKSDELKDSTNALTEAFRAQQQTLSDTAKLREAGEPSTTKTVEEATKSIETKERDILRMRARMDDIDKAPAPPLGPVAVAATALPNEFLEGPAGGGEFTRSELRARQKMLEKAAKATGLNEGFISSFTGLSTEMTKSLLEGRPIPIGGPEDKKQARLEGGKLIIEQLQDVDDIEKKLKERAEERHKLEIDIAATEKEIAAEEERRKALAPEELRLLRERLTVTDELGKKLAKIEEERRKTRDEAGALFGEAKTPLLERAKILRDIDKHAAEDSAKAHFEAADKVFEEGDRKNREFTKRRESREKDIAKLSRDLERENMGERAAKIAAIRDRLEDRRKEILEKEKDPEERRRLLGLAAGAAERELASLKAPGGDKLGITGLHDAIQKGLFSGTMEKDMATTANNTTNMKNSLRDLINAVRNGIPAVAG